MVRRCCLLIIPFALTLVAAVCAEPDQPIAGLTNFHPVAPGIYRGAVPTVEGLKALRSMGVRTIIDLRIEKERKTEQKLATALGFTWIGLPMGDDPPTAKQLQTFLSTLAKAPGRPVFVHCHYGCDRTGGMFGLYRVHVQGWSFAQAYAEMRKYGFNPRYTKLTAAVKTFARS